MKPFTDSRRIFWIGGIAVLILGFISAALLLPGTSKLGRNMGPAVHVPRLQNIPPENQKVKLETAPSAR
jgi:hypothetical protein